MNRKNKKGFTLIEMIIVMMLTVLTISVVSSIFFMGNTVFSNEDNKTTLQMEKQDIEDILSKINMQAVGISSLDDEADNVDNWIANNKYKSINEISIKYVDAEKQDNKYVYTNKSYKFNIKQNGYISINNLKFPVYTRTIPVYTMTMIDEENNTEKILSRNITDFKVKPNDKDGVIFHIELKKQSLKEVNELSVNFAVSFRNRNSVLDDE